MTAASRWRLARKLCAGAAGLVCASARAADSLVLSTSGAASGAAGNTAATHTAAPVISNGASLAQAGLGLFAVIALILATAWVARRAGLMRQGAGGAMKVVGSLMLGARQRLVMIEVGDTWIVLGVSAGEIRPLHTMPAPADRPQDGQATAGLGPQAPHTMSGSFAERLLRSMQENLKK